MNYQITEDEFSALESVMQQLGFVRDLCAVGMHDNFQQLDIRGLLAFNGAQEDALRKLLDTVTERHEAQWEVNRQNSAMGPIDWVHALRIASGDQLHTPRGAGEQITRNLVLAAQADPDMKTLCDQWMTVLVDKGARGVPAPAAVETPTTPTEAVERASKGKAAAGRTAKPKATPRKRQKLVEGAAA